MKSRVFIGSSAESIPYADAVLGELERECEVTPWYAGTFNATNYTMEDLENAVDTNDFAIFICGADDVAEIRGISYYVTRDNTLFEMGLFWGKLKKGRVFFLVPSEVKGEGNEEYHLLSDLTGIEPFRYQLRTDSNLSAAVRVACGKMLTIIKREGKFIDRALNYDDLQSDFDQLHNASSYLYEISKQLISKSNSSNTKEEVLKVIVDTITIKFDTHAGFHVTGVGLWEGDISNDKINHIVGKIGLINSYPLKINEEENNERILVVDCFKTHEEIGVYRKEPIGAKYIFCYPLNNNYVLAVNIAGRREMNQIEYDSTFFLNQKLIEIVNSLL